MSEGNPSQGVYDPLSIRIDRGHALNEPPVKSPRGAVTVRGEPNQEDVYPNEGVGKTVEMVNGRLIRKQNRCNMEIQDGCDCDCRDTSPDGA